METLRKAYIDIDAYYEILNMAINPIDALAMIKDKLEIENIDEPEEVL